MLRLCSRKLARIRSKIDLEETRRFTCAPLGSEKYWSWTSLLEEEEGSDFERR